MMHDKMVFSQRLTHLRQRMKDNHLQGYIVPTTDEHLSEYVPECAKRLEWLTGFSGSWGVGLVCMHRAALMIDGRYTLQAQEEVDSAVIDPILFTSQALAQWVSQKGQQGTIGYDPWTMPRHILSFFEKVMPPPSWSFQPLRHKIIDHLWGERPSQPRSPLCVHPILYAGEDSLSKRQRMWRDVESAVNALVMTDLTSLAWLLNLRGSDIPCTPLAIMYGVLHRDGWVDIFIDLEERDVLFPLQEVQNVRWHGYRMFSSFLKNLIEQKLVLQLDPDAAPVALVQQCQTTKGRLVLAQDPSFLAKACKNTTELQGTRHAHRRDGVALVRFFAWLFRTVPQSTVTEMQASEKLASFRQQGELYQGPSFATISASGPHGAVIHYTPRPHTDRDLAPDELYLLDSGGQYLDGTTDVTRTVAFSIPPLEQRRHFTHVLKGHIALARAIFPQDTDGSRLDALARCHVWQIGWDYNHGTGHGVGSYLSVHEGPQRISSRPSGTMLQEGMLLSNEPGLYKPHAYGIRIENVMAVVSADIEAEEDTQKMLAFETLTRVPIDLKCIEVSLLTHEELGWLNTYHQNVYDEIAPYLDTEDAAWLHEATQPLVLSKIY